MWGKKGAAKLISLSQAQLSVEAEPFDPEWSLEMFLLMMRPRLWYVASRLQDLSEIDSNLHRTSYCGLRKLGG